MFGKKLSSVGKNVSSSINKMARKPVLIITANFYQDMAETLVNAAIKEIKKASLRYEVVEVPGVFELPAAISMAMRSQRFSCYVALGCVIRGETTHYDYVCTESARGLNELAYRCHLPIGYGVITAETKEQALHRADSNGKNVGGRAALAALAMRHINNQFPPVKKK